MYPSHSPSEDQILNFAKTELNRYLINLRDTLTKKRQKDALDILKINWEPVPASFEVPLELKTKWTEFQHSSQKDAFYILSIRDELYIFGKSLRAQLFGMYTLLETLGIRWFFPGKHYEQLPQDLEILPQKISIIEIPVFQKRGVIISGSLKVLLDWIDFAAKSRLTTIGLTSLDHLDLIQQEINCRGLELEYHAPVVTYNFYKGDKIAYQTSESSLVEYKHLIRSFSARVYGWPVEQFLRLSLPPVTQHYHLSDLIIRRFNYLINSPHFYQANDLIFIATRETWRSPERVRPHPHMFLGLSPRHRCFSHAINDPLCKINRGLIRPEIEGFLKSFSPEHSEVIESWLDSSLFGQKKFDQFGWEYLSGLGRIPHCPHTLQRDLQYFRNLKITRISTFATGINSKYLHSYTSPLLWLYPKLVWNPEINTQQLMKQFCKDYYASDHPMLFFDENEGLDPKDLSATRFSAVINLTRQRIQLLKKMLSQVKTPRNKTRIAQLLDENRIKLSWKNKYWKARVKGFLNLLWFQIRREFC